MESTRQIAFEYSPIKCGEVRALCTAPSKLSPHQLAQEIASVKQAQLEEKLIPLIEEFEQKDLLENPFVKKPKGHVLEIAFSAYLGALFDVAFSPEAIAWQNLSREKREVKLVANYSDWQAVKKVELAQAEKKRSSRNVRKHFRARESKTAWRTAWSKASEYENFVAEALNKFPERKSFARLPEILRAAANELPKTKSLAGSSDLLEQRLQKLFYYACFERAGFTPFVSTDEVSRIWPELKIHKPCGNFGGRKKSR